MELDYFKAPQRPACIPCPLEAELAGVVANDGRMPVNGPDGHSSSI